MKTHSFQIPVIAGAIVIASLLAGCVTSGSLESRIREKQAAFDSLDAANQQRLLKARLGVGDTMDMVYISWGKPERLETAEYQGVNDPVWVYYADVPAPGAPTVVATHNDMRMDNNHVAPSTTYVTGGRAQAAIREEVKLVFHKGFLAAISEKKML